MTRGILLIAFGDRVHGYGKWAHNMAHSIKRLSNLPITLVAENDTVSDIDLSIFDKVVINNFERVGGMVDACEVKINMNKWSEYDQTIYLDVDGVLIKDITPLFDEIFEKHYVYSQSLGQGGFSDSISYSLWASNEQIWEHYKLSQDAQLPAVQSSIIAWDNSKKSKEFFKKLQKNYENKIKELTAFWGESRSQPDELYYSATMAQLGVLPDISIQPVYFPKEHTNNLSAIVDKHYILALWGARDMARPFAKDWYDRLMNKYMMAIGRNHIYKCHDLYNHKFLGRKK